MLEERISSLREIHDDELKNNIKLNNEEARAKQQRHMRKDNIIIASRKISMIRVALVTMIVLLIAFLIINPILQDLNDRIIRAKLTEFRNNVIYYEILSGSYPETFDELIYATLTTEFYNPEEYIWIAGVNGGPPELIHRKTGLSSEDMARSF